MVYLSSKEYNSLVVFLEERCKHIQRYFAEEAEGKNGLPYGDCIYMLKNGVISSEALRSENEYVCASSAVVCFWFPYDVVLYGTFDVKKFLTEQGIQEAGFFKKLFR